MRLDTTAIHADRELNESESVAPPLWQTSTWAAENAVEFLDMATRPMHDRFYGRYGNPTLSQAQAVIAALEGTEASLLLASGMAAITTTVLALVQAGDHVIAQKNHYASTLTLAKTMLPKFGVATTMVDQTDPSAFEGAIRPETKLILLETPTNPLLQITDIRAVAALARGRGIVTAIDNTFATPVNQRPAELGIDLVMHSATKAMGGHADVIAGAVAGPHSLLERIWDAMLVLGGSLDPFAGWLLLRGLRTMPLRVERQNRNAMAIAQFLERNPRVERVFYPGLPSHPQHQLANDQMSGFGGVLSFELCGDFESAERFVSALRLPRRAVSLGGYESLIVHPAAMWAHSMSESDLLAAGIRPSLLRFSIGIEDEADLIADLDQALEGSQ